MSWNVHHLSGDPLAVRRVLRSACPDLVCLQESPRLYGSGRRLASIARDCGLRYVTGGRSAAANAILCSQRVRAGEPQEYMHPMGPWARIAGQRRGGVLATVTEPGCRPVRVAGVHLGLDRAERLRQVQDLIARLATARLPVIVAGDLNEPPGGPAWQALSAIVADPAPQAGATFSSGHPRRRIDAVLTGPGVETLEYGQWHPGDRDARLASDHLPVLAVLRTPPAA